MSTHLAHSLDGAALWEQAATVPMRYADATWAAWCLPGRPDAAKAVRDGVRTVLNERRIPPPTIDTIELVVSELTANAIRHVGGDFTATVGRATAGGVLVEVTDGLPSTATALQTFTRRGRAEASEEDEGGRGLTLIRAFATAWARRPLPSGNAVWAYFATTTSAARREEGGSVR